MSDNVIRLLPAEEEAVLRCYVTDSEEPASLEELYDALEVPADDKIARIVSRLQIAVAQILLHQVQDRLPQRAAVRSDGERPLKMYQRHRSHYFKRRYTRKDSSFT